MASNLLIHYDPLLPQKLATDASLYELGAVIFPILPTAEEHLIAFASRSHSASEKNYSQINEQTLSPIIALVQEKVHHNHKLL